MSDYLRHGEEMQIMRRAPHKTPVDISALVALSPEELQARREQSAAKETVIFDKLCADTAAWEAQAAETALIDLAAQYLKTPACKHTDNKWQLDEYGNSQEASNMVYKMWYRPEETTRYDAVLQQRITLSWHLTWSLIYNSPVQGNRVQIDGQTKKRFPDKAAMEKYLQGRIKAYSHLFTELSPPIPKDIIPLFSVNGQLLPGYRIEGQERPSALDRLAAAKEAAARKDAGRTEQAKGKNREGAEH